MMKSFTRSSNLTRQSCEVRQDSVVSHQLVDSFPVAMDKLQEYAHACLVDLRRIHSLEDAYQSMTVRVSGIMIVTALVLWISSGTTKKPRGKKSRKSKKGKHAAKKSQKEIEKEKLKNMSEEETIKYVLDKFTNEYEEGLHKLLENYDSTSETMQYQRNFYNEMLLHLLLDLDGVHLGNLEGEKKEQVRLQRKAAIKKIQLELKKLDKL
ncbi:Snl1p [Kluyveromyces lactis]|uniref:KLLA0D15939p n=1 Tax=Kluyveromyces lactis (strain ATCC 8585 / CBS 2359 / DSM 70799 / NBRC 1267 / NRRL Y-1140 / WM37) TaxID=284590 RepID=Q6CQM7_KLULA|nr:uncharacterized protein KLLA0_D15939g [Kluyveromyces lactis]CAH00858.1 KLLA0D15939p [Kluyveromyces lactis]|eukprot:XP_453762.1 uncharacterized protein KLLA0_D15939g [Kluyveromyces lactis]